MKRKKLLIIMMIITLLTLPYKAVLGETTSGTTQTAEKHTIVSLKTEAETIEQGVPIEVELYIKNTNNKIISIDTLVNFNEEVFNEIQEADVVALTDMDVFYYDAVNKNIQIVMMEGINEGSIAKFTLTPKVTLGEDEKVDLMKLYDMYLVTDDFYEEYIEQLRSSVWTLKDVLYLSTEEYKIGDDDTNNYEEGDMYLSNISKETTKQEFIDKLDTNADEITIIKLDGTELQDNEFVGTGMILQISKGTDQISVKIAVMGDLDGNGKVTATDLSAENQTILKLITLEDEYFIAADIDENQTIGATDLSTINQMIIGAI